MMNWLGQMISTFLKVAHSQQNTLRTRCMTGPRAKQCGANNAVGQGLEGKDHR